jgi:hypothetical protein
MRLRTCSEWKIELEGVEFGVEGEDRRRLQFEQFVAGEDRMCDPFSPSQPPRLTAF